MARSKSRTQRTPSNTARQAPHVTGTAADVTETPATPYTATTSTNTTTTNATTQGESKMAGGLTQEQINALMATTRTKGQYIQLITEFLDSDENGVDVKVQWPELSER